MYANEEQRVRGRGVTRARGAVACREALRRDLFAGGGLLSRVY